MNKKVIKFNPVYSMTAGEMADATNALEAIVRRTEDFLAEVKSGEITEQDFNQRVISNVLTQLQGWTVDRK